MHIVNHQDVMITDIRNAYQNFWSKTYNCASNFALHC